MGGMGSHNQIIDEGPKMSGGRVHKQSYGEDSKSGDEESIDMMGGGSQFNV
jgi:hypothetical protein